MNTKLVKATSVLYDTFAHYPLRGVIEVSPLDEDIVDQNLIRCKPLKNLLAEDLVQYSMQAVTTWGRIEDFKHFLPRLLELSIKDFDLNGSTTILEKLEYGKWRAWPVVEQNAISSFVLSWWEYSTSSELHFQGENLLLFIKTLGNVESLLSSWKIDIQSETFLNLISYIFDNFQAYKVNKQISKDCYTIISIWLVNNFKKLEQGFYFYEQSDPALSQKISYCYDIVKHLS